MALGADCKIHNPMIYKLEGNRKKKEGGSIFNVVGQEIRKSLKSNSMGSQQNKITTFLT